MAHQASSHPQDLGGQTAPRGSLVDGRDLKAETWSGVAACAIAVGVLDVILLLTVADTGVQEGMLTFMERLSVLAIDLLLLAVLAGAVGLIATGLRVWFARRSRTIGRAGWFLIAWIGAMQWFVSWGSFVATGTFFNWESIDFWLTQPIQTLHWVPVELLVTVGIAAATLAGGLVLGVPFLLRARPRLVHRLGLVASVLVVGLAYLLVAGLPSPSRMAATPVFSEDDPAFSEAIFARRGTYGAIHERAVRQRGGAFSGIGAGLLGFIWPDSHAPQLDPNIEIVRRPLVSMPDYLAGVDDSRVRRWNVIVVLVESLRADQLRIFGGTRDVMPHTDAMAGQALAFTRAWSQSSHSNYADVAPVSGHYPLRSPDTHVYPPDPLYPRVLLWDILKPRGYRTAIFSSQNEWWGKLVNYLDTGTLDVYQHAENYDGDTYVAETDTGFASWVKNTKHAGSVDDKYTVQSAVDWIEKEPQTPFVMYMNLQSSHTPYVVPEGFDRPFGPDELDFSLNFGQFPENRRQVVMDRYADSLHYVDLQLGVLFDALRAADLWEKTIIVLSGDTGQAFMEHGFAAHASALFEEVQRVPLLIKIPATSPALRDEPVQHVDIAPTIIAALGLPQHPSFQGVDLTGPVSADRSIFMVCQTPIIAQYAIVKSGFKLMLDDEPYAITLFDLGADPGESLDVQREHPDLTAALRSRLQTWRAAQLEYYANRLRQQNSYPPVIVD